MSDRGLHLSCQNISMLNNKRGVQEIMSNKLKVLLLCFLLVCTGGICKNLHVFYEQNGDCFMLVGNGDYRGVYALNNLTNEDYNWMYDPFDSYGITAGQWWTGTPEDTSESFIEKRLYTFWASAEESRSLDGVDVKRRVIPQGKKIRYTEAANPSEFADPPYIIHTAHSDPTDSPTGLGNHTYTDYCQSLKTFFTPSDIPCTKKPQKAGKDSEGNQLYWVTSGVDWYHDRTRIVWSGSAYSKFSKAYATGHGNTKGGYVHRVSKEFLTEYTKDINLMAMNINNKKAPIPDDTVGGFVAKVVTGTDGYAKTLGECVDGCITAQPQVTIPGTGQPILSLAYSSGVKRSYLYNRPYGETDYDLKGKGEGDVLIGVGNDLSTKFIGISSRDNTSNFVYLLGSKVINDWLTAANVGVTIADPDDLSCVAVSDQWWQTGGIVYAYDSKKGKVYSFVRVEGGYSGLPDEIDVHFDGRLPDKIGTDGFGNLYVLKTELDPPNTKNFGKDGYEEETRYSHTYDGENYFIATFRQHVYKTVYKRPYGLGNDFSKIKQRIPLGVNEFEKEYTTADNKENSPKIWTSTLTQTRNDGDGSNIRTELAVINIPTPPEPVNTEAIADCCGPLEQDPATLLYKIAEPDNDDGSFSSTRNIIFMAENAPSYDANGLNIAGSTEDKDEDGAIGCYPNTIKESSVVYHWKIIRTKDRFGKTVNPGDKDYVVLDTVGNYLLVFPSLLEGEFEVGLRVEYRYYDYTKLKVGALASEKETCLYPRASDPPKVALARGRIVHDGYSWERIKQTWVKPPESKDGYGIIMTSLNSNNEAGYKPAANSTADATLKKTYFVMDGASLCKKVENDGATISYKSNTPWGMKLRETQTNLNKGLNRIEIITNDNPPDPNDPQMVPGTLQWVYDYEVYWKVDLKRGSDLIWSNEVKSKDFNLTLEQLRQLMPIPSDPLRYSVTVSVSRQYTYEVYVETIRTTPNGWEYSERIRVPVIVTISIDGEAEVCVTDNTGPSLYQYNAETKGVVAGYKMVYAKQSAAAGTGYQKDDSINHLKVSTGETIAECNPNTGMIFYVCDNNPMANYTGTPAVNTTTKDPYHKTDTDTLRASFNKNDRKGLLHYDTADGIMPTAALNNLYKFTPIVVDNEAELKGVGLVPSKTLSYVKYEIPAGCMKHFSNGTKQMEGLDKDRLPFNYATNTSGYKNYKFGLSWVDSCNATYNILNNESDVVGSVKNSYFVGTIVIKDNDRPNIFITGFQDRFPDLGSQFRVPSIITEEKYDKWFEPDENGNVASEMESGQWFLTVDDKNNGQEKWFTNFGGNLKDFFTFSNPKVTEISSIIFRNPTYDKVSKQNKDCRLLTDVPATFKYVMVDNSGKPKCNSFTLYDEGNNKLAVATDEAIQYVFRKAGKYYVELEVEDNAKAWPDNANAINNPTNAKDEHMKRILRGYFEVLASRFDYRVLERGINEE